MVDHIVLIFIVAGAFCFLLKRFVVVFKKFFDGKSKGSFCGSCKGCAKSCVASLKQEK